MAVLEGPPELLPSLARCPRLRLLPAWVSRQTKEQFVAAASALVQQRVAWAGGARRAGGGGDVDDEDGLAKRCVAEVRRSYLTLTRLCRC